MKMPHPLLSAILALPLALGLSHCGKKEKPAPPAAVAPAPGPTSGLAQHAARLGFAGQLPMDTEFYFGSANLKGHVDTLKKTAFYKEIAALANDKTPAPAAGDKTMKALQKLWGDEMFLAGAAGIGEFGTWFRQFNRLYNELNFRMLMSGGALNLAKGASPGSANPGPNPVAFLQTLLGDPAQLDRAGTVISGFELPPLIVGFKVVNPAELMHELIPDDFLKQMPPDKVTVGSAKIAGAGVFTTLTTEGSKLLPNELKQQMLANLPPSFGAPAKQAIEKSLTAFQAKKFAVAWGPVGDYLVFTCGRNLDHLKFAATPAASLLMRPELARLAPYAEKNMLGLLYANAAVLSAVMDDQPFTPMLRGVFGAMKESPVFGNLGTALEGQLKEYTPLEVALFKFEVTPQAAALWWDHGVHLESFGGVRSRAVELDKPLQFARFVNRPEVVLGFSFRRDLPYQKLERAWMEKLVQMGYTAAQELVKAGIAGPQGGQNFAMFEEMALPSLKKLYDAGNEMSDKGFGGETAFLIDLNGKLPSGLPGVPPEAKDLRLPRVTTISEVTNRSAVAAGWKKISDTISESIGIFTGGPGTRDKNGNPTGAAPSGIMMPEPISSEKNGVTSYFFGLPFLTGDLLPCASINDHVLLLSTSKDGAEALAGELTKPATDQVSGLIWKIDPGAIMDWVISVAGVSPGQSAETQKEMKQVQKWAKPFHAMQGRIFRENNVPRASFSWEITDLVSFD